MRTTTFVLAFAVLSVALVAAPLGALAPAHDAKAYICTLQTLEQDPAQYVDCATSCMPDNPEGLLHPRVCPN